MAVPVYGPLIEQQYPCQTSPSCKRCLSDVANLPQKNNKEIKTFYTHFAWIVRMQSTNTDWAFLTTLVIKVMKARKRRLDQRCARGLNFANKNGLLQEIMMVWHWMMVLINQLKVIRAARQKQQTEKQGRSEHKLWERYCKDLCKLNKYTGFLKQ